MATTVHFINVGQGNMVLVECANGASFVADCNITDEAAERAAGAEAVKYIVGRDGVTPPCGSNPQQNAPSGPYLRRLTTVAYIRK